MKPRKVLGLVLIGCGIVFFPACMFGLAQLGSDSLRFTVFIAIPAALLAAMGAVLLLAEGEMLAFKSEAKPDEHPKDGDGGTQNGFDAQTQAPGVPPEAADVRVATPDGEGGPKPLRLTQVKAEGPNAA